MGAVYDWSGNYNSVRLEWEWEHCMTGVGMGILYDWSRNALR